jgi:regulator of sirC expression with transglutaminase-like and TPR domain
MRAALSTVCAVISLLLPLVAKANAVSGSVGPLETVRSVLATTDTRIDLARAKLMLDRTVDPATDVDGSLRQIASIAETIKTMTGASATPIEKLAAVRRYLYVAGSWNQFRAYAYDRADPLGTNIREKLLANYLNTRIGNCVSLPILFIILGDRLGVHVTASTVPFHVLARYVDDAKGKAFNIEATSGGYPARDAWYREKLPMTDEAVRNGVYLKTLSKRETVAVMAEIVLEHLMAQKRFHEVPPISDLIMDAYPQDTSALLAKGSAYAGLIQVEFRSRFPTPADIPLDLRATYMMYAQENRTAFAKAEALGWRESDGRPQSDVSAHR